MIIWLENLSCSNTNLTGLHLFEITLLGQRFAAALLPRLRLFGKNPRSHRKGSTGRVWTGDELLPVLCHCQLGQHIPTNKNLKIYAEQFPQKLVCLRGACFQPRFELPKSHFSWRLNLKEILTHNYFDCLFQAPQVLAPDFRKERVKVIMNKNLDWNWGGTKLIFIVSNANYFVATLCSLAAGGG